MYPQGYFHQTVSPEGWQQEVYERLNWANAPVEPAIGTDGRPCVIAVPLGNRTVLVSVWQVLLGRVRLFLLDTDLEENAPWDRELSARLYGGDRETRIQQEIILGIGGVRALKAMGIQPAAWHLNEGHAAFVVLQRIRDQIETGASFDSALEAVRRTTDLHDAHAGSGRPRRVPVQPRRDPSRGRVGHARRVSRRVPRARPLRQRQRPALQHDRARAADRQLRQRRQPAARPGDARDVGAHLAGRRQRAAAGPRDHQRHPRPDLAVARDGGAPRRLPARRLARPRRRPGALGRRRAASRTNGSGRRGRRSAPTSSRSSASARASGGKRSTSRPRASSPPARCSIRARSPSASRAASPATSARS